MDAQEKYLFDVNGYLVVEDILDDEALAELNVAIDECQQRVVTEDYRLSDGADAFVADRRRLEFQDALSWPGPHGDSFRRLIAHPPALRYALELIGDGFRVDSLKGTVMTAGTEGFVLHGGAGNPNSLSQYRFVDGRLRNTLINVAYALTDVGPRDGGFVCIPGSHKANMPCPPELSRMETGTGHVTQFPLRAGSAVIFSEALIHGTLPWTGRTDRRTAFVRYSAGALLFRRDPFPPNFEHFADELTELQKALFEPPYYGSARPSIAALLDGA
jgi:hypothetical protein